MAPAERLPAAGPEGPTITILTTLTPPTGLGDHETRLARHSATGGVSMTTPNLDLIPKVAPCDHEDTAVNRPDDDTIDCVATRVAHGCPWARDLADVLGDTPNGGLFGVPCFLHARIAQRLLEGVTAADGELPPIDLYGNVAHGHSEQYLSPEHCRRLARWMLDRAPLLEQTRRYSEIAQARDIWMYTIRWLVWISDEGEGALAWY